MIFAKRDPSIKASCDVPQILHGVKITKLPVAKYLAALDALSAPVSSLIGRIFPDMDGKAVLEKLAGMDDAGVREIATQVIMAAPREAIVFISGLLDIPPARLLDPAAEDALTLTELAAIVEAFWRKNDLTAFFETGRRLADRLTARAETAPTGCSD